MTMQRRDGKKTDTDWTRRLPALSSDWYGAADGDLFWHSFTTNPQLLMLIEQKTYNAKPTWSQMDTLNVVDQMLQLSSGKVFQTKRGLLQVRYGGLHVLTFSGSDLEDSQHIYWDGLEITRRELIEIMRFEASAELYRKRTP